MSIVDDGSSEYSRTTTLADPSHVDKGKDKIRESVTREFGMIVEMDELDEDVNVEGNKPAPSLRSRGSRGSKGHEHADAQNSTLDLDFIPDDASTVRSSRRASQYSIVDSPGAGPSRTRPSAAFGPYRTAAGSGSRRSLRFENSKTSFLDVTDEVSGISKYPVSEGAFCDVHEGHMEGEGKVALKRLRMLGSEASVRKRFRYEAEIWYRLNHPNVLKLYGLYQDGPVLYMVSPWQENGHMSAYFKANPAANKLLLLRQVTDALAYLHSNDPIIIHGDVKGQNVLISQEGNAILCDFGLSMILCEIAGISALPTGVQDGGSTRYMAPELMQGDQPKTNLSDTYAYAMLMIEVFSGSPPFPTLRYDATLVTAVISGQRPPCPFDLAGEEKDRNERLWRLMQVCWHTKPQYRPVMSDVHGLMQEIVGDTEMRQCVLKEFVILGQLVLDGYTQWATKGDASERGKGNPSAYVATDGALREALDLVQDEDWVNNPHNPHNWSLVKKGAVVGVVGVSLTFNLLVTVSNSIVAPVLPQIAAQHDIHSATLNNMVFSIFTLALSFGPLVFLPISEIFGRLWVFHTGVALLVAFNIACAYAPSVGTLIALRFLAGLGGSAMSVSTAILIDVFQRHRRMVASSTTTISMFLGSSIGPIIGGQITERVGLKWIFLVSGIACGVMGVFSAVCLRETYPHLLRYRIHQRQILDGEQQHENIPHFFDFENPRLHFKTVMKHALVRPFQLPFVHFMCFVLLLYVGLLSGIYYLLLATFPVVFQETYSFSVGDTGLAYIGPSSGILLSVGTVVFLHRIFGHLPRRPHSSTKGDPRILMLLCTALTVPVGLFIYGWTVQAKVHFIAPIIGAGYFTFTMAAIFLPVQYYLVDAITVIHPASGMAAVSIARFTFGFAFPLFGKQMMDNMGSGAGYSLLAGLTIAFGIVIPLIAYFFGGSKGVRIFSAAPTRTLADATLTS